MENVKVLRYIENINTGRLSIILGKHAIKELQKNSHFGHCRRISESTNVQVQNIFHMLCNITCSTL
jgi:hypothetical protein